MNDARRPASGWGVIEEYGDRLDIPDGTPTITLREGGTPLVESAWLSHLTGAEVWLKVEGDNPTGSFKDRGMTVALSVAVGQGAEAVVCASTGNTSASMAAYAARAGVKPLVLVPQGKISAGKLAQAILHGAQVIMVRGNFDDCLRISRGLAEHYPVALVNSVNPMRLAGPEDRLLRDRRLPRRRPRRARAADRQRRQHLGVLARLPRGPPGRRRHPAARDARLAGRGRRAARPRRPGARPRDRRLGHPDRQPRVVGPRRWRRADASGGKFRQVTDAEILAAQRELASRDGVFVEPASAAGVAGLLLEAREGVRYAGQQVVVTVTGHGLKDIDTALSTFTDLVDTVCDADVDAAAAAAGLA